MKAYRNGKWAGPTRPIYVILSCTGERMNERKVKTENIEEDIQGRDVLTFKCPQCGQSHKSLRFG